MILILKAIPNLTEQDMSFVMTEDSKHYADFVSKDIKQSEKKSLLDTIGGLQPQVRDLLYGMTEFNPYFRQSANEMLHAEVFAPISSLRNAFLAKEKIYLEVDQDDAFDYEAGKSHKFLKQDIISMILKDAKSTHQARISFLKKFRKEKKSGLAGVQ